MPDSARARGRGVLSLVLLLFAARSEGGPAVGAAPSLDMGQALQNERMIRRALGIDPFLPGSLGDVIDASLYPRPHRLARHRGNEKMMKTTVANTQKKGGGRSGRGRYVPASSAASRHHVRTPSNVLAVEHTSGVFLMVASFQTDYVFKYNLGEGLGHPEVFASHVSCDLVVQSACTELSGPWGMATHGNEFFVASFGTDRILILDLVSAKVLGEMGNSEELNGPEDLAMGPQGQFLFVSSYLGGEILQYDVRTRALVGKFAEGLRGPEGLAVMQSGILVAACNTDHSIRFFDLRDGSEMAAFVGSNVSLQYPIYAHGFGDDRGDNTTEDLFEAKLEKPIDAIWLGGNRVLVTMAGAIGSFLLDQDHARVHFEGFARLAGNEKLKSRHPSGMSALGLGARENPMGSTLFVAGYDAEHVLVFQLSPPDDGSGFELNLAATGRL